MEIKFLIPRVLTRYTDDHDELTLSGSTVGAVLKDLSQRYPTLHQCVCNETGVVRPHIHLFVNEQFVYKNDVNTTTLRGGDVVSVFQAVSGG